MHEPASLASVHFHEVGAVYSIADIVGIAIALDQLQIEQSSLVPLRPARATVRIAHGLVSVPAPATAELLQGIPVRESSVQAELTTPPELQYWPLWVMALDHCHR